MFGLNGVICGEERGLGAANHNIWVEPEVAKAWTIWRPISELPPITSVVLSPVLSCVSVGEMAG